MKNSKLLFRDFTSKINLMEEKDEIASIGYIVFEHLFGISRATILVEKEINVTAAQEIRLDEIITRLNAHEPVQYIVGEAYFHGRKFKVNPSVLIPRSETEELVTLALHALRPATREKNEIKVLDVGTGSGCIAILIALALRDAAVYATDVSNPALTVAKSNAKTHHANVQFLQHDVLLSALPQTGLDLVVSNPPYITLSEQDTMKKNVVAYEPHLALFVDADDPLLFYKAIADKSKKALKAGGILMVEINEKFGREVSTVFYENGFQNISIVKDIAGKDRIVKGIRP